MIFTACLFNLLMLFEQKGAVSFEVYNISRSLTIPGWILLTILLLALLFGAGYLSRKVFNKTNLK